MAEEVLSKAEQESLDQFQLLLELKQTKGFSDVLKPFLDSRIKSSFIDPRKFKTDEEYIFACKVGWGWAQAASEVLEFIEVSEKNVEFLKKKGKGELEDKFRDVTRG